jgi:hypothetical protein
MKALKAKYLWLASVGAGILANYCLHQYRFHLYYRNADYPECYALQRLQYALFLVTVAVMVVGAAWFAGSALRRRRRQ